MLVVRAISLLTCTNLPSAETKMTFFCILYRLGIQPLFGDEPTFSPRKTAGRVRSGFVQIDQSGIRLPRLRRRNNYINYLCLHFQIHFTFFTWYLLRTFSGMFCVTDIAFYVLQKLTDFLAKQNHDLLQSAREYS